MAEGSTSRELGKKLSKRRSGGAKMNEQKQEPEWGVTTEFDNGLKVHSKDWRDALFKIGAYSGDPDRSKLKVKMVTIALSPGDSKTWMEYFTHWLNLEQIDYQVIW